MSAIDTQSALRRAVEEAGCFEYAPFRSVASLFVHIAGAGTLVGLSAKGAHGLLSVLLFLAGSLLWYRIGWLMHDAAHGGVFASARANQRFAALCAGVLGEFPSGWRYGHNRHHAAPNVLGRDMDQMERWDPSLVYRSRFRAACSLLLFSRYRGYVFPKTMLLLGLRDGVFCYRFARKHFVRELIGVCAGMSLQIGFLLWLSGPYGLLLFLAHMSIGMLYLNTVFAGNHYDLESFDEAAAHALDFADLQIRTTRNYSGGPWARFVFGGLERQIEHHLFPNMPRHRLQRAEPFVRAYCAARGIAYRMEPFHRAILRVVDFHLEPSRARASMKEAA